MVSEDGLSFWARYNANQAGRAPRPHCLHLLDLAGPGQGRTALDIGCGEGNETLALLRAGWSVIAVDSDAEALGRLRGATPPQDRSRIRTVCADIEDGLDVPPAALIYSGYTLPWVGPDSFGRTWNAVRRALVPGGWVGVASAHDLERANTIGRNALGAG